MHYTVKMILHFFNTQMFDFHGIMLVQSQVSFIQFRSDV